MAEAALVTDMELDSEDDNPNDKGKQPVHYTMKQFQYHAVVIDRLFRHWDATELEDVLELIICEDAIGAAQLCRTLSLKKIDDFKDVNGQGIPVRDPRNPSGLAQIHCPLVEPPKKGHMMAQSKVPHGSSVEKGSLALRSD